MPGSGASGSIRAFVALPLPQELVDQIRGLQRQLGERLGTAPVRWTSPDQVHLTLRFFGNIQSAELEPIQRSLRQAAEGCGPFQLMVRGIGCFPSFQKPSVMWVGLEGDLPRLLQLQRQVEQQTQAYGSHQETRPFHPHLTLGRTRAMGAEGRRIGAVLKALPVEELGGWQARELELIQSKLSPQGSVYSRLAQIPLNNAQSAG